MKRDRRVSKDLSARNRTKVKKLHGMGLKIYEISDMLSLPIADIRRGCKEIGLRSTKEDHSRPIATDPGDMILVNSGDEMFGKSNPFISAKRHPDLCHHFTSNNGIKYYKGIKLNTYADWTPAIRDLNRIRKAQGLKQFDYVAEWAIK
jgi:hypothetical protein